MPLNKLSLAFFLSVIIIYSVPLNKRDSGQAYCVKLTAEKLRWAELRFSYSMNHQTTRSDFLLRLDIEFPPMPRTLYLRYRAANCLNEGSQHWKEDKNRKFHIKK